MVWFKPAKIEMNSNGVRFRRSRTILPRKGGGRRGKVTGFSLAAARRLKETLFRCDYHPKGMGVIGICCTLPEEAEIGQGTAVWEHMRRHATEQIKDLVALVWRKEVQQNGREHFHAVVWTARANPLPVAGALIRKWCKLVALRCRDSGAVEQRMNWVHFRGKEELFADNVSAGVAAHLLKTVPCLTPIDSQGKGVFYLISHAGRFKSYQSQTTGRAWGIWNRRQLPLLPPESCQHVSLRSEDEIALARFMRNMDRHPKKKACVFGSKLRSGCRFARGTHIVASPKKRDAVRRFLQFADTLAGATCIYAHNRPQGMR